MSVSADPQSRKALVDLAQKIHRDVRSRRFLTTWENRWECCPGIYTAERLTLACSASASTPKLGGSGGDFADVSGDDRGHDRSRRQRWASISALFTHGIALPHVIDEYHRRVDAAADVDGADYLLAQTIEPVLRGEMILSLGVTEPDGGFRTFLDYVPVAERVNESWDPCLVRKRTSPQAFERIAWWLPYGPPETGEGAAGITLMMLDPASPGYATPRALAKMGPGECSDTAETRFQRSTCGPARCLGDWAWGLLR